MTPKHIIYCQDERVDGNFYTFGIFTEDRNAGNKPAIRSQREPQRSGREISTTVFSE